VRILVISNVYPPDIMGGYEICCRQVTDALRGRGHDVRVLTSAPRFPAAWEPHVRRRLRLTDVWSPYLFQHGAPVTAHLNQAESHRVNASNVHALLDELEQFQPDVVYLHMLVGIGGLGLLACLEHLRIPWVWQLGDNVPVRLCEAAGRQLTALAQEYSRQIRGHYIAVSRQLADAIESAGIRLHGVVDVLPNWIIGPRPPARTRFYRGGRLRIAAAAAVIDRRTDKGIELAIEAAGMLHGRRLDFSLDIFGDVADPFFPSLILKRGVGASVRLQGAIAHDKLTGLYEDFDVFLFPTRPGEPFGVAPLEAAARGCVPLMSHTCGIAEWLVHGAHCLKAPRRASAFANCLGAIMDGAIDLELLGRRTQAVVQRDFHLDALIGRIEALLARASRQPRTGRGTPAEAYRLALLAEGLTRVLVQENLCA
jgi:glycosyltransferase involved in cell wall biosynthesis